MNLPLFSGRLLKASFCQSANASIEIPAAKIPNPSASARARGAVDAAPLTINTGLSVINTHAACSKQGVGVSARACVKTEARAGLL